MDILFSIDDGFELERQLWSGGLDTWHNIQRAGKTKEAFRYLQDIYCTCLDRFPTITEVNDLLWFESSEIYEALGLNEDGDEEEEEEEEEL